MLDVLARAELADSAAAGQLPRGVLRHACQGEQGDLLVAGFQLVIIADNVAEPCGRVPEGLNRLCASNSG